MSSTSGIGSHLRFHTFEVCASELVMVLFAAALLKYTAFIQHQLKEGDASFKPQAILPTFRALLWTLGIASMLLMVANLVLLLAHAPFRMNPYVYVGLLGSGRHFLLLVAPVFIYQPSLSRAALCRSVLQTMAMLLLGLLLFAVHWIDPIVVLGINIGIVGLFFVFVVVFPPSRASFRVLCRYAGFAFAHVALVTSQLLCIRYHVLEFGSPFAAVSSVWTSMTPLVVWQLLRSDTEYWRGKGLQILTLQRLYRHTTHMTERVSAEGLHMLIEMHRKHVLDFASIELRRPIGDGMKSLVLSGLLRASVPVAVKVYTPSDLSDHVMAEFSQEAALCGNLMHPNIVAFYGLSVCPPTISLVFELCRGSLRDLLVPNDAEFKALRLLQLTQMLDAARAIAYLHSFSPPFVHRELELASFLIDVDGVVKLSGFGDSRVLHQFADMVPTISSSLLDREDLVQTLPVHPPYDERIDIFALGIVFWKLLHPQSRFPYRQSDDRSHRHHHSIVEFDERIPDPIRLLVENMMQCEIENRPTATYVVERLETLVETQVQLESIVSTLDQVVCGNDMVNRLLSTHHVQFAWQATRVLNMLMEIGLLHEERHADRFRNAPDRRYFFVVCQSQSVVSMDDDVILPLDSFSHGSDCSSNILQPSTRRSSKFSLHRTRHRSCRCQKLARRMHDPCEKRRLWPFGGRNHHHHGELSSSFEDMLTSVLLTRDQLQEEEEDV